jgi:hypothetical protein
MKHTAVEWLQILLIPDPISEDDFEHNIKCWKQAKEIEMRQIMEAFNAGEHYDGSDGEIKYYKETFKTNEK